MLAFCTFSNLSWLSQHKQMQTPQACSWSVFLLHSVLWGESTCIMGILSGSQLWVLLLQCLDGQQGGGPQCYQCSSQVSIEAGVQAVLSDDSACHDAEAAPPNCSPHPLLAIVPLLRPTTPLQQQAFSSSSLHYWGYGAWVVIQVSKAVTDLAGIHMLRMLNTGISQSLDMLVQCRASELVTPCLDLLKSMGSPVAHISLKADQNAQCKMHQGTYLFDRGHDCGIADDGYRRTKHLSQHCEAQLGLEGTRENHRSTSKS